MTAFKRPGSKYFWIGPFRAGSVDVPRMTTGQTNKSTGRAMEEALRNRAVTGYADVVQMVASRSVSLDDFYAAHIRGPEALDGLRQRENDRPLADVVEEYKAVLDDVRALNGLEQLVRLAPKNARFSWLRVPKTLTSLYQRAVRGEDRLNKDGEPQPRSRNSVRRSLHRAVAGLLAHELGRGQMLAILADVTVPSTPDERSMFLSMDEIHLALEKALADFRPVLGYMLTTGIDLLPMLNQKVFHYDENTGTLQVPDTKTPARMRTLALRGEPVLENAEYWLRQLIAGRKATDPLVPLTRAQVRKRWSGVREAIGRPDVRLKDLRGIFATYYLTAGGDPRGLQLILGHTTMAMTLRYLRRQPAGNKAALLAGALLMGLPGGTHLRVQRGGVK